MSLTDDEQKTSWRKIYGPQLWRIALLLAMLVALIVLRKPCAEGVANFMGSFAPPAADAGVHR